MEYTMFLLVIIILVIVWTIYNNSKLIKNQNSLNEKFKKLTTEIYLTKELIEKISKEKKIDETKIDKSEINSLRSKVNSLEEKISDIGEYLRQSDKINKQIQGTLEEHTQKIFQLKNDYNKNNEEKIKKEKTDVVKTEKISLISTSENKERNLEIVKPQILFRDKKVYDEDYKKIYNGAEEIKQHIESLKHEDKTIFAKMISQYQDMLNRIHAKINLDHIDEDEYSEVVTYKYMEIIERDLLKILQSAIRGRTTKKNNFYIEVENKIKESLAKVGIIKKEIECEKGKKVSDEAYKHMNLQKVRAESEVLHETIKSIDLDPYAVIFLDEDGEEKEYITKGKISVLV
ncbi:MAG: hypothetical protein ACRCZR_02180 [Cetobacterium sp.]